MIQDALAARGVADGLTILPDRSSVLSTSRTLARRVGPSATPPASPVVHRYEEPAVERRLELTPRKMQVLQAIHYSLVNNREVSSFVMQALDLSRNDFYRYMRSFIAEKLVRKQGRGKNATYKVLWMLPTLEYRMENRTKVDRVLELCQKKETRGKNKYDNTLKKIIRSYRCYRYAVAKQNGFTITEEFDESLKSRASRLLCVKIREHFAAMGRGDRFYDEFFKFCNVRFTAVTGNKNGAPLRFCAGQDALERYFAAMEEQQIDYDEVLECTGDLVTTPEVVIDAAIMTLKGKHIQLKAPAAHPDDAKMAAYNAALKEIVSKWRSFARIWDWDELQDQKWMETDKWKRAHGLADD